MTKLEAWKAWGAIAGTESLSTEFSLEKSSHGKAFSFAWDAAYREGYLDAMGWKKQNHLEHLPPHEFIGLDLKEMDEIIDGNMKITDSRLRDAVYAVVIDTMTTLMEKNSG